MAPLKPYGTLNLHHVYLDSLQRELLYRAGVIEKRTFQIHINQLRDYRVSGLINHINDGQIRYINQIFDGLGYRKEDGEVYKMEKSWRVSKTQGYGRT